MSTATDETIERTDDTLLDEGYFEQHNEEAIYIGVLPFPNLVPDKIQGLKLLEEASEAREMYDKLMTAVIYNRQSEESVDFSWFIDEFILECCDCIQATVNLMIAVLDKEQTQNALINGIKAITDKNAQRGYYNKEEQSE